MNGGEIDPATIERVDKGFATLWLMHRGWLKETPEAWAEVIDGFEVGLRAAGAK